MVHSIIIARSSKDRNEVSCESQIYEIQEEARRRGEIIHNVLSFPKTSHTDFNEEPEFQDILSEVKSKSRKFDKIWFFDTARVSRDRLKAQTIKRFLQNHNVAVEFLKLPKTGNEAYDNLIEGILENFDQLHSDHSRAGAIRGQKQNIRNGYRAGGKAPYGYRLKKVPIGLNKDNSQNYKTVLEPDPETFQFAQEYFYKRNRGESRRSIFNDFENRGIKNPSGNTKWSISTGKSMEENIMVYQGHTTFNRHNQRNGRKGYKTGKKWKDLNDWEIKYNTHERCIDDEMAKKIKSQLNMNKKNRNNPGSKKYLLTDILYCGDCGSRMVGNSGYYSCQNKMRNSKSCSNSNIKADSLNEQILILLKEKLIRKEFYDQYISAIKAQYEKYKEQSLKNQRKHLKRMKELERQIEKLLSLFSRRKIKAELIEKQIEPLQQERDDLKSRVTDITDINEILEIELEDYTNEAIRNQLNRFEKMLNQDNMIEMRALVRDFIFKITLDPKDNPKSKKWKRHIHFDSHVRALTMIQMASPRGFEPLLPA